MSEALELPLDYEGSRRAISVVVPVHDVADTPPVATKASGYARWSRSYVLALVGLDVVSIVGASLVALFTVGDSVVGTNVPYAFVALGMSVAWLLALQLAESYEPRRVTDGEEEFRRLLRAAAIVIAVVSIVFFATNLPVARRFVFGTIVVGFVFMTGLRFLLRGLVHRRRRNGYFTTTVLVVGTSRSVRDLAAVVARMPWTGLRIVAACVPDAPVGTDIAPGVPVVAEPNATARAAAAVQADVVALAGHGLGPHGVRELGWQLEGTGRELVMAPELTDVAGPRLHVRPVEGLPLVWVDQPRFSGVARVGKRVFDIVGSALGLILASPILLLAAIAIKVDSPGPVFYRQKRVGLGGREFTTWKLRSMYQNAEARRADLLALNEKADGLLFKIRLDPRVTPVGRVLRKLSIDELPQLINVLRGEMSMVGPRPPLPDEVAKYPDYVRRRLLVKPGITGMWQVSGRSDLSWEESIRLDLYYVENWSLWLDLALIIRTFWAVVRCRGAY